MSYQLEYIGDTQTFKAAPLNPSDITNFIDIFIETGKQYIVELQQDGPITVINGQMIIDPNATFWIIFPSFGGRIPYSPEAILKQWKMV